MQTRRMCTLTEPLTPKYGQVLTTFADITRHGRQAQSVLALARSRERGTPLMPLGLVIDKFLGYMVGVGPETNSWDVLPMSGHDMAFDDLLNKQLYVPSGLPDAELKTTPHGEIADVILSDADPSFLSLYPEILLVGDQNFSASSGLVPRLLSALARNSSMLMLQPHHVDAMGAASWAALNATQRVRVLRPAAVPGFHPPGVPAISDAQLREIGRRHLPVVVVNATLPPSRSVSILWQVNAVADGFVVELSNEWGVDKRPCDIMRLDPEAGTATVTLQVNPNRNTLALTPFVSLTPTLMVAQRTSA